tara:strand:+ start:4261 stop:4404 length:144 start_codon:yes stop_codon:yes gene_type:complete
MHSGEIIIPFAEHTPLGFRRTMTKQQSSKEDGLVLGVGKSMTLIEME